MPTTAPVSVRSAHARMPVYASESEAYLKHLDLTATRSARHPRHSSVPNLAAAPAPSAPSSWAAAAPAPSTQASSEAAAWRRPSHSSAASRYDSAIASLASVATPRGTYTHRGDIDKRLTDMIGQVRSLAGSARSSTPTPMSAQRSSACDGDSGTCASSAAVTAAPKSLSSWPSSAGPSLCAYSPSPPPSCDGGSVCCGRPSDASDAACYRTSAPAPPSTPVDVALDRRPVLSAPLPPAAAADATCADASVDAAAAAAAAAVNGTPSTPLRSPATYDVVASPPLTGRRRRAETAPPRQLVATSSCLDAEVAAESAAAEPTAAERTGRREAATAAAAEGEGEGERGALTLRSSGVPAVEGVAEASLEAPNAAVESAEAPVPPPSPPAQVLRRRSAVTAAEPVPVTVPVTASATTAAAAVGTDRVESQLPAITVTQSSLCVSFRLLACLLACFVCATLLWSTRPSKESFGTHLTALSRAQHGWLYGSGLAAWQKGTGKVAFYDCAAFSFARVSRAAADAVTTAAARKGAGPSESGVSASARFTAPELHQYYFGVLSQWVALPALPALLCVALCTGLHLAAFSTRAAAVLEHVGVPKTSRLSAALDMLCLVACSHSLGQHLETSPVFRFLTFLPVAAAAVVSLCRVWVARAGAPTAVVSFFLGYTAAQSIGLRAPRLAVMASYPFGQILRSRGFVACVKGFASAWRGRPTPGSLSIVPALLLIVYLVLQLLAHRRRTSSSATEACVPRTIFLGALLGCSAALVL